MLNIIYVALYTITIPFCFFTYRLSDDDPDETIDSRRAQSLDFTVILVVRFYVIAYLIGDALLFL